MIMYHTNSVCYTGNVRQVVPPDLPRWGDLFGATGPSGGTG